MWYFLAAMVLISGILIWDYRRKKAKRDTASQERFEQMFKAGPLPAAASGAAPPAAAAVAPIPAAPGGDPPPEPASTIAYSARPHVLGPAEKLIYLLLKTGLPELEVFPKLPLAAIIDIPGAGYDREQQLRRLSRQVLDFVVCNKEMKVVAAVQLAATGPEGIVAQRIRAECLKAAGIRLVTIESAALPKRAEVRAFIFGEVARPAAGATPRPM